MCLFCFDGHRVPTLHHFLLWHELTASPDSTHGWLSKKKTTPEKQTVKCTWTAVLTPKPTTTERISDRKIQRCSQIISISDQWKAKSKWCLCVYQVQQESFHQPCSHSGLGCVCTTHFFSVRRQIWTFAAHSGHSSVKSERKLRIIS